MTDDFDFVEWDDTFGDGEPAEEAGDNVAYIKREVRNFRPIYVVYDAMGERLSQNGTRREAILWAEQNDLMPADVQ